jgi:hypothetical protein
MSCIPKSGGCERWATDVLVNHINWLEDAHFEHQACLDQTGEAGQQPECLYINTDNHQALVIERKSISWPEEYAYRHSKDHDLANAITGSLDGTSFQGLYVLRMPSLSSGSKRELRAIGQKVAEVIGSSYAALQPDQELTINCSGHRFKLGILPLEERGEAGPDAGLCFSWELDNPLFEPEGLQEKVVGQIENIYADCVHKFAAYSGARRVLMLDPHGDVGT